MSSRNVPDITLTSTTSAPITHTTTTTYTIGGRRNRNQQTTTPAPDNDNNHLHLPEPNDNGVEPFPTMPSPTPNLTSQRTTGDYFSQPPARFQSNPRAIGLRRLPSSEQTQGGRPRSGSGLTRRRTNTGPREEQHDNATAGLAGLPGHYEIGTAPGMERIDEGEQAHHGQQPQPVDNEGRVERSGSTRLRRASNAARSMLSKLSDDPDDSSRRGRAQTGDGQNYESDVVDYLDVLDPEVSTLTTLTNVQNSLFVPDIPFLNRFYNRRPTYELSSRPSHITERSEPSELPPQITRQISRQISRKPVPPTPEPPEVPPKTQEQKERILERGDSRTPEPGMRGTDSTEQLTRRVSITSHVEEDHFAVLPHGVTLEGWSEEDVDALDDYVRHMLHSRRSRFKRSMRGFGKYIRKPLGFFVTLYAFLITAFGFIWVLFLIGWISLGNRKDYIVHIVDSVLVALFAVMGDGLAPFRAVDTYHMIYIAHYHRLSWKIRQKKNLPKLADHNDLPERTPEEILADAEAGADKETDADWEFSVLTPEQQRKLVHHQNKFSKSHSYYRPHETTTHYAFPLKLLITIVSLLDAHSLLQIMLGSFTWGWSYHTRPEWITAVILSISITVNITAGVIISIGDKRTRKKDVLLRMARQGLTEEAMRKVEKQKREAEEDTSHLKPSIAQAHAQNVAEGVVEPRDQGEFEIGAEQVKEKLKGYTTDFSDSDDERKTSKQKSNDSNRLGVESRDFRKASPSRSDTERGLSTIPTADSFKTAPRRLD